MAGLTFHKLTTAGRAARWMLAGFLLAATGSAAADDAIIAMVAMHASKEKRAELYFDRGLEHMHDAVASLVKEGFDTFRKVKSAKSTVPFGQSSQQSITPAYTLYCTPQRKDDAGRIQLELRIEKAPEKQGDKPAVVVKTSLHAVPGHHITIPLPKEGDSTLVVVLTIEK